MKLKDVLGLVIAIVLCEAAGILGTVFTSPAIASWYSGIQKSPLNPPNWIFGPVWTLLFALMGIALFLVLRKGLQQPRVKAAVALFAIQLGLNVLWSAVFFGQRNFRGAFVEIIFLWLAILATIILFSKISKPAAWLLVPYLLWVGFASYLNYSIWQLNPQVPPVSESRGSISLPQGYTLDSYKVEQQTSVSCRADSECVTPPEYLVQSRCPFTSLCLENRCAVVCPEYVRK